MRAPTLIVAAMAAALTLAACGSEADPTVAVTGDGTDEPVGASTQPADDTATSASPASPSATSEDDSCDVDADLVAPGTLTVATGEPVFEPWMVDDDPANGQGFEGALVAALADQMGFGSDQVMFVRTGFDEVIAPGAKDWDFNIQQFSINDARDEVVDFSTGYYSVQQAVVAAPDSPAAAATSIAELAEVQLGAAIGTTSFDYAEEVIAPTQDVLVFDDNVAAKAAFDAGQVDGLVFDLPTAYFITAVEIPEASIVGVLPAAGDAEELGLLFEEGNPLVACVDQALAALGSDGTLEDLQAEWLTQGGDIPTLSN